MAKKAVQTNADNFGYFNPQNIYRPEIIDIELIGEWDPNDGAINTYRITQNDGKIFDFDVKNGSGGSTGLGISRIDEIPSVESSGVNVLRVTYTDGTHQDFEVRNGAKGDKGDQGIPGPAGIDSVTTEVEDPEYSEDGPEVEVGQITDGVLPMTFKHIQGPQGVSIESVEQTTTSQENGGTNVVTITLENGETATINIKNGKSSAGFFATSSALSTAIPSPNVGDYAFVSKAGDGTFPAYIYVCTTAGTWTATTAEYDGDDVDLTDYATKSEVNQLGQYDVTLNNNNHPTFASLSALLSDANLSTLIPASVRTGGMSIRFVQTSDNKYVQYRLMADEFSTQVADWQGVDDKPTTGSENLVKSGGVAGRNNAYNFQTHKSLFGEVLRNSFLNNYGTVSPTTRNNVAVTSYIKLNGDDIGITKVYYSQYGPVIAFYDINKRFKHYWNPTGEMYNTIIPVIVPASEIQSDDYYVRATIADDGLFVSGFDNLAITSQKANDALLPSLITLSGADRKSGKYINISGNEEITDINNASASPFIILDGNDIVISQLYYASGYSCGIAFYNKAKIFTHQYTPDNLISNAINKDVIISNSVILDGDVYARTTLWGNGTILSGFKTLAQKAEEDAQKALRPDLLALFGEDKKVRYYIGLSGEEQYSGRSDIAVSPYYCLNGEELAFSLIIYSQYGNAVSFYNDNKVFISGWNPSGEYGKMAITVPVSDIPSDAVYVRVTLADDGEITGGFYTLAQKAENDAQKALEQEMSLPAYWLSYLVNKLPLIHANQEDNALNGDSFYFLTDYHIESNAGYSHKIIQYLCEKTTVQNMVYGGDSFNGSTTKDGSLEKLREFYYRFYPINMFGLRGNHEFNLNDGGGQAVKLGDNQIYNYLMRKIASEIVAGVASPMYYYKDVDKLKLRYIYLDARYENNTDPIDDTQIQWMKDRITELQSGWSVILFSHQLFTIVRPGAPVVTNPGYNASGTKIINALTSITPDATIIAIIAGHCHYDFSTNEHGFWEISTTCDTRQEYGGLPQTLGTPNEQAFDVFSLNLEAKTIKAVRIGRGSDRNWSY